MVMKSPEFSECTTDRLYRVQKDDDLRSIAERLYGVPDFWIFIYGANVSSIRKTGGIQPGQVLVVPELQANGGS
jgi:nucleoid-associated protein YgaU